MPHCLLHLQLKLHFSQCCSKDYFHFNPPYKYLKTFSSEEKGENWTAFLPHPMPLCREQFLNILFWKSTIIIRSTATGTKSSTHTLYPSEWVGEFIPIQSLNFKKAIFIHKTKKAAFILDSCIQVKGGGKRHRSYCLLLLERVWENNGLMLLFDLFSLSPFYFLIFFSLFQLLGLCHYYEQL